MFQKPNVAAGDGGINTIKTLALPGEEWVRLPKPKSRFWGLSRTTILEMVQRGDVKSCVIKKRHAIRGIRLVFLPSLRDALNRLADQTQGEDKV
jgi:hypothetical protein